MDHLRRHDHLSAIRIKLTVIEELFDRHVTNLSRRYERFISIRFFDRREVLKIQTDALFTFTDSKCIRPRSLNSIQHCVIEIDQLKKIPFHIEDAHQFIIIGIVFFTSFFYGI